MTDRNEAYDAFILAFNPNENGYDSYPAKTRAMREGAKLVRALVEQPHTIPPEIHAAEIQAIGAMVSSYIGAESDVTLKTAYEGLQMRHRGIPVHGYPRELALKLKGPDFKLREKLGKLATRIDPRKKES